MLRSRSWFATNWNRPKNRLSLDHLKYLHNVLEKNTTVSENNRGLLVESLRCIAEILIWGDQHDSSVFDFFLEKSMLSYFLHIMRQKSGGSSFVCVQLLQTLNILFENIRNETSLYYLLSNNHVNSIIVHKFDFSDEDVMGYYILFLKTLSLKLNVHTVHFFYNEHTNDFPLYTEAIKFFNHPESMVRIAVRTITLNVYRVQNVQMLKFIRDKTAVPYFSNLVWFIGKHILELDACVQNDTNHQSQLKLSNLVAEHLDHLHYLNDIFLLDISHLNQVLTEHLLQKLFVPLYIYSLNPMFQMSMNTPIRSVVNKNDIDFRGINHKISTVISLYLLALVFLVINHMPLIHALSWILLSADHKGFKDDVFCDIHRYINLQNVKSLGFSEPKESLEEALEATTSAVNNINLNQNEGTEDENELASNENNITDEEKEKMKKTSNPTISRPFLDAIISFLDCKKNDYMTLISLCLLYALANNKGGSSKWLDEVLSSPMATASQNYRTIIVENLLQILKYSCQTASQVRLITFDISLHLLIQLTETKDDGYCFTLSQKETLLAAKDQAKIVLRNFYKSEDIFLDLFEHDYNEISAFNLNVEYLCMDANILLQPTGTPLTGINFERRLPCGEVERARRAIRIFFSMRKMCQKILSETEQFLPLTHSSDCVKIDNVLDLNNSDLIGCTVITKDSSKYRRFLVIDSLQFILVEPDAKRLGWGVAKFVGFLQNVEVVGDKEDSRCLHITVQRGGLTHKNSPILSANFVFDDHIRCMAAKQRLIKGRSKARQKKMYQIAQLLEIPIQGIESFGYCTSDMKLLENREQRLLFSTANRIPGFAAALKRDHTSNSRTFGRSQISPNRNAERLRKNGSNSKESITQRKGKILPESERTSNHEDFLRLYQRSEEIPLEDFPRSRNSSPTLPSTSSNIQITNEPKQFDQKSAVTQTEVDESIRRKIISSEETSFMAQNDKNLSVIQNI